MKRPATGTAWQVVAAVPSQRTQEDGLLATGHAQKAAQHGFMEQKTRNAPALRKAHTYRANRAIPGVFAVPSCSPFMGCEWKTGCSQQIPTRKRGRYKVTDHHALLVGKLLFLEDANPQMVARRMIEAFSEMPRLRYRHGRCAGGVR